MRTRILPPEEWHRLNVGELPALLPYVAPQNIAVIVVEDDDGEIIGCLSALQVTHLEGLWIKPGQNGIVGRALLRQAGALARVKHEDWVFGTVGDGDDRMDGIMRRLGGHPVKARLFSMGVN